MYVIDSNVFSKLFIEEADSEQAQQFFIACLQQDVPLIAPTLLKYEVLQTASYYKHPLEAALQLLDSYSELSLKLQDLNAQAWAIAEQISQTGHLKSGFPSLYDSCYHALAIEQGLVFITADKRHFVKAEAFGHIMLLKEWNNVF
jgi:predicted nucleic acid-binding protein